MGVLLRMNATHTIGDDRPSSSGRAVVLGGTGFIGRPVCRALASAGYDVVAVARHARPATDVAQTVALDLASGAADDIAGVLRDQAPDVVVNAAGGMWGLTDDEMVLANVTLTENVISATASLPGRTRLIQLGTVHEYGVVPIGTTMDEDMVPEPITAYGRLKLRCTEAVVRQTRAGALDGIVLRVGNVTGAGQPRASLLGVVAEELLNAYRTGRSAVLSLAPLGSQRDFLNLRDAVSAVVAAATVPTLPAPILNIGAGRATAARTLVELLIAVSGVPTELSEAAAEAPETVWQQMRNDRAIELLGWIPSPDLTDGVRELWTHITADVTTAQSSLV